MKRISDFLHNSSASVEGASTNLIASTTNDSFKNDEELMVLNTVADGDCVFHAVFATNIDDAVCRCNVAKEKKISVG